MDSLRYLLAAIAALTLIMSVVSPINPGYFAGLNAFADHDEEEEYNDESEEEDDEKQKDDDEDEEKLVRSLGNNSEAELEVDTDEAELKVEIEDGDLDDGTYDVSFACESPDLDEEFEDALEVDDGEGEFEQDLSLPSGTYSGCEVEVGGLSATFPSFKMMANDDDDDEKDEDKEDDVHEHGSDSKKESQLEADEDGAEIKVNVKGLNMTDGPYDAVFACDMPTLSVTLDGAFEVEDGDGKLEETIGLTDGTYRGCDITVQGTVLASFNAFTISEESEEEHKQKIEEKRKEKNEKIVTIINGTVIHKKHISQNAASPGEYDPGWNYTLAADGTAAHDVHNGTADHDAVDVDIDMAVWKSNNAIILLDVIDGTVEVENQTYTVVLGYALYTIQHDTFRLGALAVDDNGNVLKLKLRGSATDGEFPAESGSIELEFEGSSGPADQFGDWELAMDGTITAG